MSSERFAVHVGDNLPILKTLPDNSVDAIVTDPPAGISMMGKDWDSDKGGRDKWIEWMSEVAAECLRVIKPGGHALVWALPRTSHWTATAWEDAGWEPRDRICHIFGSGFPKSANISKQIDRMAGAEREVVGFKVTGDGRSKASEPSKGRSARNMHGGGINGHEYDFETLPATDAAKQWDGWGTALKPAVEDYWLFRKPIEKGLNIAQNVLKWGTGGLNIDATRVGTQANDDYGRSAKNGRGTINAHSGFEGKSFATKERNGNYVSPVGRFPAHLIHDGSEEVEAVFPMTKNGGQNATSVKGRGMFMSGSGGGTSNFANDSGSASRFFYCAKPGKRERDAGLEELEAKQKVFNGQSGHSAGLAPGSVEDKFTTAPAKNFHVTVKALKLMTYLCRLITPPDGLILDPFTGSGSTGCAAMLEGFRFIGMEQSPEYAEIAQKRIEYWHNKAQEPPPPDRQLSLLDVTNES